VFHYLSERDKTIGSIPTAAGVQATCFSQKIHGTGYGIEKYVAYSNATAGAYLYILFITLF
jgi:hypothetical protein